MSPGKLVLSKWLSMCYATLPTKTVLLWVAFMYGRNRIKSRRFELYEKKLCRNCV